MNFAACPCCGMSASLAPTDRAPRILTGLCRSEWWSDTGTITHQSHACAELERRGQRIELLTAGIRSTLDKLITPAT